MNLQFQSGPSPEANRGSNNISLFGPGIAYAQNRATQKEENLTHNKAANYN
jgi:hypothetical protein